MSFTKGQVETRCLEVGQVRSLPTARTKQRPPPQPSSQAPAPMSSTSGVAATSWKRFSTLFEGMRELQKHGIARQRITKKKPSTVGLAFAAAFPLGLLLTLGVQGLPKKRGADNHRRIWDAIWKDYTSKLRALETDQPL